MSMQPHERHALTFLLRHLLAGLVGAACFGGLILYFDFAGIRSMARADESGWLFIVLLFFGLAVTFGSVAMACGVMSLGGKGRS